MTITPITTVRKEQIQEASPEQKIRKFTKNYLEVLYNSKIDLISTDYFTDGKRFASLMLYTEEKITDKNTFRLKLLDYLQSEEDLIDVLSINREENYTEPEKVKEKKDEYIDQTRDFFNSFFTQESSLEFIDINNLDSDETSGMKIS